MTDVIPIQGMRGAPHLDFAGMVRKATGMPTFHAARIPDVATARHAIKNGLLDMVGMTLQLFRSGDAVSARNTHAAIYDARRLVKDL